MTQFHNADDSQGDGLDELLGAAREDRPDLQGLETGFEDRVLRRIARDKRESRVASEPAVEPSLLGAFLIRGLIVGASASLVAALFAAPSLFQLDDLWLNALEPVPSLTFLINAVI